MDDIKQDSPVPLPPLEPKANDVASSPDGKFTYFTKNGQTAHFFNVSDKGEKVEFDSFKTII